MLNVDRKKTGMIPGGWEGWSDRIGSRLQRF